MFHALIYLSRGVKLGTAIATVGGVLLSLMKRHKEDMASAEKAGAMRGAMATYAYTAENGCPRCNGNGSSS